MCFSIKLFSLLSDVIKNLYELNEVVILKHLLCGESSNNVNTNLKYINRLKDLFCHFSQHCTPGFKNRALPLTIYKVIEFNLILDLRTQLRILLTREKFKLLFSTN